jgi:hypothetical protein
VWFTAENQVGNGAQKGNDKNGLKVEYKPENIMHLGFRSAYLQWRTYRKAIYLNNTV